LKSINVSELNHQNMSDNSIIIEEKENDESTKYSKKGNKSIVLPEIKHTTPLIKGQRNLDAKKPAYYYSLRFERNKLGTLSTKVIKEQVNRIK
jgi:hypothetical protein